MRLPVKIFENGQKIHFIKGSKYCARTLYVIGGCLLAVCLYEETEQIEVISCTRCFDWVLDVEEIGQGSIVLVTAHNQAQLWSTTPLRQLKSFSSEIGHPILYCATLFVDNDVYVLAGTVFSEVVVWKLNLSDTSSPQQALMRLKGHKGVIFSISVKKVSNNRLVVCTTSDDRTIRLSVGSLGCWDSNDWQDSGPLYGHTARVWNSLLLDSTIFTIGEDSAVCCWSYDGILLNKLTIHPGTGILSIAFKEDVVITGGGDGGIYATSVDAFVPERYSCLLQDMARGITLRKVVSLQHHGIACLTDDAIIYLKNNEEKLTNIEHELIKNCTDMKVSPNSEILAICTVSSDILLIDISSFKKRVLNTGEIKRCESLLWYGSFLLVQIQIGLAVLYQIDIIDTATKVASFQIPKSKEKMATCFLRMSDNTTVLGDRFGHLHLFDDLSETPLASLAQVHGYLGVSDLMLWQESKTILSVGAGGWIKETSVVYNDLIPVRSYPVPMESAVRLLHHSTGLFVAGFHGSHFQLWDFQNKFTIGSRECGGGHRSYDFELQDAHLNFLYVKDKSIHQARFGLELRRNIRTRYHAKTINCLRSTHSLLVSGGDDNKIIVARVNGHDVIILDTLQHHISAVRSIKLHAHSQQMSWIIAVGGREQLSVSQLNCETGACSPMVFGGIPSQRRPTDTRFFTDCRYMCVDSYETGDILYIFVGCSDCTLRIFSYCDKAVSLVRIVPYSHCILQLLVATEHVITFATDGKAVFWQINELLDERIDIPTYNSVGLHQSGINSAVLLESKGGESEIVYSLVTGGDDNTLHCSVVQLTEHTCRLLSTWSSNTSHSCQITGLAAHEKFLLSTGIDQRVVVHRLENSGARVPQLSAVWLAETVLSVPDVHGLTILTSSPNQITICAFGRGIQVINIDHLSAETTIR